MKIVIVEDEIAASKRLSEMILAIEPETEIVQYLDTVSESVEYFTTHKDFDLVFMDIHLADGNSFEIFKVSDIQKPVVFTTAYDEYAIKAFKMYTLDYLLKPIKQDQLLLTFKKYHKYYKEVLPDFKKIVHTIDEQKRFLIRFGSQLIPIPYNEVALYYTSDKISFLITFEGRRYPIEHSLDFIEENIANNDFFRINRQFIIHRDSISKMSAYTKSRVKITLHQYKDGDVLVSVERSPHFKRWLKS